MEITSIASFADYYKRIKERTRKVIDVIPEESLEWTFREGKFTLADQVRHIAAIERYMFVETLAGRQSKYYGCGKQLAEGKEAITSFFDNCRNETEAILVSLGNEQLSNIVYAPGGAQMPAWKWMRAMIEHEIHHRAQIYLYLSMLNIPTPPIFGLTAEEVEEKSYKYR